MAHLRNLAICLLFAIAAQPLPSQAENCYRKNLDQEQIPPFLYALTTADLELTSSILLSDQTGEEVRSLEINRFTETTTPRIEIKDDAAVRQRAFSLFGARNGGIQRIGPGFMQLIIGTSQKNRGAVESVNWYDHAFHKLGVTSFPNEVHSRSGLLKDGHLLGVFDWIPIGNKIFGYGSTAIEGTDAVVQMGFFTATLPPPNAPNFIPTAKLVMNFPDDSYYSLTYPYMAAEGDFVFFLAMGVYPELYSYNLRTGQRNFLKGLPGTGEALPRLDSNDMLYRYQIVERSSLPVGIFTNQTGRLYVLYRTLTSSTTSRWYLQMLLVNHPANTVKVVGEPLYLPTQREAGHLKLLPGRREWFFFELAAASSADNLVTRKPLAVVSIPANWIERPSDTGHSELSVARNPTCVNLE